MRSRLASSGRSLLAVGDVFKKASVDFQFVSPLLKGNSEHIFVLDGGGDIACIDFHHVVAAFALTFENFQRLVGVVGGDDAVGYFPGDEFRRGSVTGIGQSDPVAVGGHPIGAPGSRVGAGHGRKLHIVHKVDFFEGIGKGQGQRSARRGNMLEGSGGRDTGGLFQFLDKLPAVKGVQKVDVAGLAV